ncbi:MAG: hypothetical protein ACOYUZ_06640 [Patescibacteria group bacterium]
MAEGNAVNVPVFAKELAEKVDAVTGLDVLKRHFEKLQDKFVNVTGVTQDTIFDAWNVVQTVLPPGVAVACLKRPEALDGMAEWIVDTALIQVLNVREHHDMDEACADVSFATILIMLYDALLFFTVKSPEVAKNSGQHARYRAFISRNYVQLQKNLDDQHEALKTSETSKEAFHDLSVKYERLSELHDIGEINEEEFLAQTDKLTAELAKFASAGLERLDAEIARLKQADEGSREVLIQALVSLGASKAVAEFVNQAENQKTLEGFFQVFPKETAATMISELFARLNDESDLSPQLFKRIVREMISGQKRLIN